MIYSVECTVRQSSEERFRKFLSSEVESASKAERESKEFWINKRFIRSWREAVWIIKRGFRLWKEAVETSKPIAPGGAALLVNPQEWLQQGLNLAQAVYLSVLFKSFRNNGAQCFDIIATYWQRSRICFESAGI